VNFQVTAISHIEAKKRFEFLEAVSATMDSHLRYFKQVLYILSLGDVILCHRMGLILFVAIHSGI
jgi:hypothetical protein